MGFWKDGKKHGYFDVYYSNGNEFSGDYRNDLRYGKNSTFTYLDGKVEIGDWIKGFFVKSQKIDTTELHK